jgi:class 3 adenylate cyclase
VNAAPLVEATLRDSLEGVDEVALVSRLCDRLVAAGLPLTRMAVACDMLDPSFDSHGVTWKRGEGATIEDYERTPTPEAENEWLKSPFHALVTSDDRMLRRRLDAGYTAGEFPVLDEFKRRGATDYVCLVERISNDMCFGVTRGVVVSWCGDGRGFDDASIRFMEALMPAFATAFLARTMRKTTRALLATYLGQDAADRVLAGNVIRGRAERLRAVVWFADLVGFTRVADTQSGEVVLAMLNDYAEAQVEAIEGRAATCSSSSATACSRSSRAPRRPPPAGARSLPQTTFARAFGRSTSGAAQRDCRRARLTSRCTSARCSTATSAACVDWTSRCSARGQRSRAHRGAVRLARPAGHRVDRVRRLPRARRARAW